MSDLPERAHIHLSGICGTGMAAVAALLKQQGFRISGSDKAFYPPMGEIVRSIAEKLYDGYSAENLAEQPDLVVIGNNLSANNPEVQAVLAAKIPYASMPEVFAARLVGERSFSSTSVVIIGTHGKTTTTAAAAYMLECAKKRPGYFIGGAPLDLPGGIRGAAEDLPAEDRIVVLEGDEYDSAFFAKWSKFLSYRPDILVMTSLEFDHADIYNSIIEIEREFIEGAKRVPEDGLILVCDTYDQLRRLIHYCRSEEKIKAQVRFYGEKPGSDYRMLSRKPVALDGGIGQQVEFAWGDEKLELTLPLSGEHNALNALAAFAVGLRCGLSAVEAATSLSGFHGVKRRQQVIYNDKDIVVIEDFAHHPTAVWVTLEGLREAYPHRRLIAVYEPRSNTSRRAFFQDEFAVAFGLADIAIIQEVKDAGSYSATSSLVVPLDVKLLVSEIEARDAQAFTAPTVDEIEQILFDNLQAGDLVVIMSNGDFGGLQKRVVDRLANPGYLPPLEQSPT